MNEWGLCEGKREEHGLHRLILGLASERTNCVRYLSDGC